MFRNKDLGLFGIPLCDQALEHIEPSGSVDAHTDLLKHFPSSFYYFFGKSYNKQPYRLCH